MLKFVRQFTPLFAVVIMIANFVGITPVTHAAPAAAPAAQEESFVPYLPDSGSICHVEFSSKAGKYEGQSVHRDGKVWQIVQIDTPALIAEQFRHEIQGNQFCLNYTMQRRTIWTNFDGSKSIIDQVYNERLDWWVTVRAIAKRTK